MDRDKMLQEAKARLSILNSQGLHGDVSRHFPRKLYYSERSPLGGILYWVDNNKEYEQAIRDFEKKNDSVVYHATLTRTEFGTILDLFYVSPYEEEWDDDRERMHDGYSCNYALNLSAPDCSEFGWESFKVVGGGVVRTG